MKLLNNEQQAEVQLLLESLSTNPEQAHNVVRELAYWASWFKVKRVKKKAVDTTA